MSTTRCLSKSGFDNSTVNLNPFAKSSGSFPSLSRQAIRSKKIPICRITTCPQGENQLLICAICVIIAKCFSILYFRCPAWCDRILMSKAAKRLLNDEDNYQYGIIGADCCMGDHKVRLIDFRCSSKLPL